MIPFIPSTKVEQFRKKSRIDQTKSSEIIIVFFWERMISHFSALFGEIVFGSKIFWNFNLDNEALIYNRRQVTSLFDEK